MAKLPAAQEVKLQALPVPQPPGALARETAGGLTGSVEHCFS